MSFWRRLFGLETVEEENLAMKLVVGLGNPGPTYARNRHNVGFQCLDHIAAKHNISFDKKNMKAIWGKGTVAGQEVILAKPQIFMNLSGQSVGEMVRFYKLDPTKDLLVIYDDLDLPVGKLRLRPNGSSGGQNGLKNIIELLGTNEIQRLRIGIGRPMQGSARDRVLNDFSREEVPVMEQIYDRVDQAVQIWLTEGILKAMNYFNANAS
jgi:PTH1 family peptidyl-tRNA hydrolase